MQGSSRLRQARALAPFTSSSHPLPSPWLLINHVASSLSRTGVAEAEATPLTTCEAAAAAVQLAPDVQARSSDDAPRVQAVEVERALAEAMKLERANAASRDRLFSLPTNAGAWTRPPPSGTVQSERECDWIRAEVARAIKDVGLHELPHGDYILGQFTQVLQRELGGHRGGQGLGATLRRMPLLGDYIIHGRRMHFVNFCAPGPARQLQEAGLGSVPCGNPLCSGNADGLWDTVPYMWSCWTSSPQVSTCACNHVTCSQSLTTNISSGGRSS